MFHEIVDYGGGGYTWSEGDPYCVNQTWDIFIYNKAPYDKEVKITGTAEWLLW